MKLECIFPMLFRVEFVIVVGNWMLNFIIFFLMIKEQNVHILRIFIIEVQIYIWLILTG